MTDYADKALLPAGLADVLPPDAAHEAASAERLVAAFGARGYERVKPPLIEFEESLLSGSGQAMAPQTFRLMDPVSQRMMGLRPDITLQVARIATTRLAQAPRPLRLSYAGQVLRVKGTQLRPERQFAQVGAELIGATGPEADAEVIAMAADALADLGVADMSADLGIPTLVPAVCGDLTAEPECDARLRAALDHKDAAEVRALGAAIGADTAALLETMLAAAGPAEETLAALERLDLPPAAAAERRAMADTVARLRAIAPDLTLTADPVENRGFEYHTGITVTFFARGVRGELGRGGRYMAGDAGPGGNDGEPATGITLFMDTVMRALAPPRAPRRLFLPPGTPAETARRLRAEGWVTVAGLSEGDADAEARRLRCDHRLAGDDVVTVT